MLTTKLIHPDLIHTLAQCGHGSKVLIADANYPLAEKSGNAAKVFLGLCPGIPSVIDVLKTIHHVVAIEKAVVMAPEDGSVPEIFADFQKELDNMELDKLARHAFYSACMEPGAVRLAISTGEQRTFANLLITIGCA